MNVNTVGLWLNMRLLVILREMISYYCLTKHINNKRIHSSIVTSS